MTKLEQAARQALELLISTHALGLDKNGVVVTALREALAEQELNLNCKSVQKRLATSWGYVKAEQAGQEPVAYDVIDKCISLVGTEMVRCKEAGDKWFLCQRLVHAMRDMQYDLKDTTPVQQVDLTDEEIIQLYTITPQAAGHVGFARAVIAAYKEKNK